MVRRDADGLAVPMAAIRRGDRVVTADGIDIGSVRTVSGADALSGRILVVGRNDWDGSVVAYAIPWWAPSWRDAAVGCLRLSAHRAYVCTHWARASSRAGAALIPVVEAPGAGRALRDDGIAGGGILCGPWQVEGSRA